jgi:hypothetical protein
LSIDSAGTITVDTSEDFSSTTNSFTFLAGTQRLQSANFDASVFDCLNGGKISFPNLD